jgi:choline dehydrogenase
MHQAGANSEDSISAIEPINTSSSNRGDIVRHLHLEQNASPNFTERVWLNQQKLTAELKPHYDFIVCGSGSSGSVVARRLAENPDVSMLLLEAGGCDDMPSVTESARWFENLGTERDWGFVSQPNQNLKGRSIPLNMGKVLGGGSSINVMAWARGHKTDWDFFASESGDPAWNYESVLNIYRRIEDWQGAPDPRRRGTGGLVFVQSAPDRIQLLRPWWRQHVLLECRLSTVTMAF